MIDLAMEIPSVYLPVLTPYTQLDFALAHQVLEDSFYADFYTPRAHGGGREEGRKVILDNSMHELGESLPVQDLRRAAETIHADWVVVPDRLGDPLWNYEQVLLASKELPHFPLAVCLSGNTPHERASFFTELQPYIAMLCLPYREPRAQWFLELEPPVERVHLLGMSSFDELNTWRYIAKDRPGLKLSVDTSKPIKWALEDRFIGDGGNLRGAPTSSKALLNWSTCTPYQFALMHRNSAFLRDFLAA